MTVHGDWLARSCGARASAPRHLEAACARAIPTAASPRTRPPRPTCAWCWRWASTTRTSSTPTTVRPSGAPRPSRRQLAAGRHQQARRGARSGPAAAAGDRRRRRPTPSCARCAAQYLARQLNALRARVAMLQGTQFPFDEESRELYDAVAPRNDEASFQAVIDAVGARIGGDGRAGAALRRLPAGVRDSARPARRRVPGGDRRVPPAHPGARPAAGRRDASRSPT